MNLIRIVLIGGKSTLFVLVRFTWFKNLMINEVKRFLIEDLIRLFANHGLTVPDAGLVYALLLSEKI